MVLKVRNDSGGKKTKKAYRQNLYLPPINVIRLSLL